MFKEMQAAYKFIILQVFHYVEKLFNRDPLLNPRTRRMYNLLRESYSWDHERLIDYQWERVQAVVEHAYHNSRYYRSKFDSIGLNPLDLKNLDDYSKYVPVMDKNEVCENLEDILAIPKWRANYLTTGGTTGIPMGMYQERNITYKTTLAFEWRHFHNGGYRFGDRCAELRGKAIGGLSHFRGKNYLYLSSYNMTEKNLRKYTEILSKFRPKHLQAYPSTLDMLSNYIKDEFPNFNSTGFLKSIFTSSESLGEYDRDEIESVFSAKIFDKYGNCEQCSIMGQCRYGNYHDFMDYSFSEYLNGDGKRIESSGEAHLISTSFYNFATPLLRYRTEDIVEVSHGDSCSCGSKHTIIKRIVGRWKRKEVVLGKQGNLVPLSALNSHSSIFDKVFRIQYEQSVQGELILKVIPKKGYSKYDRRKIDAELSRKLGEEISLRIREVEEMTLSPRGKHILLVQHLNLPS